MNINKFSTVYLVSIYGYVFSVQFHNFTNFCHCERETLFTIHGNNSLPSRGGYRLNT